MGKQYSNKYCSFTNFPPFFPLFFPVYTRTQRCSEQPLWPSLLLAVWYQSYYEKLCSGDPALVVESFICGKSSALRAQIFGRRASHRTHHIKHVNYVFICACVGGSCEEILHGAPQRSFHCSTMSTSVNAYMCWLCQQENNCIIISFLQWKCDSNPLCLHYWICFLILYSGNENTNNPHELCLVHRLCIEI